MAFSHMCLWAYCASFSRCDHSNHAESCVRAGMPPEPCSASSCMCTIRRQKSPFHSTPMCNIKGANWGFFFFQMEMAPKRFARSYSNSDSGSDSDEVRRVRTPECKLVAKPLKIT